MYAPRNYNQTEFNRSIVVLRLGGTQLLNLLHKSAGFPHRRSVQRHSVIPQLLGSASSPTEEEMRANLQSALPYDPQNGCIAANIMVNEIATKKALQLDVAQNLILGLCREHTPRHCFVEFTTYKEATEILEALQDERIHLASEATVIALGAFSEDPQTATIRPLAISGSCKKENAQAHSEILAHAIKACRTNPSI
ncbi:hypothetical protein BDV93DRAFT_513764 [Ceratobasidium sp. AG-I]|nr:hypothetical protein BDV93DRAFT_513764 [Ceratobasidium sp. AG-I]